MRGDQAQRTGWAKPQRHRYGPHMHMQHPADASSAAWHGARPPYGPYLYGFDDPAYHMNGGLPPALHSQPVPQHPLYWPLEAEGMQQPADQHFEASQECLPVAESDAGMGTEGYTGVQPGRAADGGGMGLANGWTSAEHEGREGSKRPRGKKLQLLAFAQSKGLPEKELLNMVGVAGYRETHKVHATAATMLLCMCFVRSTQPDVPNCYGGQPAAAARLSPSERLSTRCQACFLKLKGMLPPCRHTRSILQRWTEEADCCLIRRYSSCTFHCRHVMLRPTRVVQIMYW